MVLKNKFKRLGYLRKRDIAFFFSAFQPLAKVNLQSKGLGHYLTRTIEKAVDSENSVQVHCVIINLALVQILIRRNCLKSKSVNLRLAQNTPSINPTNPFITQITLWMGSNTNPGGGSNSAGYCTAVHKNRVGIKAINRHDYFGDRPRKKSKKKSHIWMKQ